MLGFSTVFKSMFDCISQIMKYGQIKIVNQETTNILTDKKDLKRAGNIAEEIIGIALKYKSYMSRRDQIKMKFLIKKFNKVD